jgi:UDP-N-acetylmuramoylalanine--D-glutamate ligase
LRGKDVVVLGLARSGIAAVEQLLRLGARVVATDTRPLSELPASVAALERREVTLELGPHRPARFETADLVIVSPGVPWDLEILQRARAARVPVVGELEFAFRCASGTVVAVTGTKGKSTTTAVLGDMLRRSGQCADVRVGGNIGTALSAIVDGATAHTTFVLETSSFQLEGTDTFRPHVATFLNLEPDHIDRHGSYENYVQAKARVFANQTTADWAVVNADDDAVLKLASAGRARVFPFSARPLLGDGAFFADGAALLRRDGNEETLFAKSAIHVPGAHLASDLLAAGTVARLLGVSSEAVARGVDAFRGSDHVLDLVGVVDGVSYYDDSKATNVVAARRGLEAFDTRVVAILGGRSKGGDFSGLRAPLAQRGRAVVLIGEAARELESVLGDSLPCVHATSLAEAVTQARGLAQAGDIVLLSPACASFDMFSDYAERGRAFRTAVNELRAEHPREGH